MFVNAPNVFEMAIGGLLDAMENGSTNEILSFQCEDLGVAQRAYYEVNNRGRNKRRIKKE